MRWIVIISLILGAHFALTAIAPGEAGKILSYWPFAKDSKPTLGFLGSATKPLSQALSVIAGLCFLASAIALFGWLIPAAWWTELVIVGAVASAILYLLYFGFTALIPLAIDSFLLLGIFVLHWTVVGLRGS